MPSQLADLGPSLSTDSTPPPLPAAEVYPSCPSPPSATFPLPTFLNLNVTSSPIFLEPAMPTTAAGAEDTEDASETSMSESSEFPTNARITSHNRRRQTWWNPHRTSPPTQGFRNSQKSLEEADSSTNEIEAPSENASASRSQESIGGQYEVELSPMPSRVLPKDVAVNSGLDSCGDVKAASNIDAISGSVTGSGLSLGSTTDSAPSRHSKHLNEPHVSDNSPPLQSHPLSTEYPFSQKKSPEDLRRSTLQVFRAAEPLPPGVDLPSYLLGERNALEKALGRAMVERGQVAALEATVGHLQSWMMADVDPGQQGGARGQMPAQHPSNSESMEGLRNRQGLPGGGRAGRQVSALDARLLSIEACQQEQVNFLGCLKQMKRQIAAKLLQVDTVVLQVAARILLTASGDTSSLTTKSDKTLSPPTACQATLTPTPTPSSSPHSKSTQAALSSLAQERNRSQRAKAILGAFLLVGGTELGFRILRNLTARLPKILRALLSPIELGSRLLRWAVWASAFVLFWGESKRGCYQLADSLVSGKGGWKGWEAGGGQDQNRGGGGGAEPLSLQSEAVGVGREEGRLKKRKGGDEGLPEVSGSAGGGGGWGVG